MRQIKERGGAADSLNDWLDRNDFFFYDKLSLQTFVKEHPDCGMTDEPTHTCLNGGVLCLPQFTEDRENSGVDVQMQFHKLYALNIPFDLSRSPNSNVSQNDFLYDSERPGSYISEIHTRVFPMYFDLDITTVSRGLTPSQALAILGCIQKSMSDLFPVGTSARYSGEGNDVPTKDDSQRLREAMLTMLVLNNPGRAIISGTKIQGYKTGFHVHFPQIQVVADSAYKIRLYVIYCLTRDFALLGLTGAKGQWDWLKIVDAGVYGPGGGLRMAHSWKMSKCPCLPESIDPSNGRCSECNGATKRSEACGYKCHGLYSFNAAVAESLAKKRMPIRHEHLTRELSADHVKLLEWASVRCSDLVPNSPEPVLPANVSEAEIRRHLKEHFDWIELPDSDEDLDRVLSGKAASKKTVIRRVTSADGTTQEFTQETGTRVELPRSDKIFLLIEKTIKKVMPFSELGVKVNKISFFAGDVSPTFIAVDSAGKCLNNGGRAHRSQATYFVITPAGIRQKCYCKCADVRATGKRCSDYVSEYRRFAMVNQTVAGNTEQRMVDLFAEDGDVMKLIFPEELKKRQEDARNVTLKMDTIQYDNNSDGDLCIQNTPAESTADYVRHEFSMGSCAALFGKPILVVTVNADDVPQPPRRRKRDRDGSLIVLANASYAAAGTRLSLRDDPTIREHDKVSSMYDFMIKYGSFVFDEQRKIRYDNATKKKGRGGAMGGGGGRGRARPQGGR